MIVEGLGGRDESGTLVLVDRFREFIDDLGFSDRIRQKTAEEMREIFIRNVYKWVKNHASMDNREAIENAEGRLKFDFKTIEDYKKFAEILNDDLRRGLPADHKTLRAVDQFLTGVAANDGEALKSEVEKNKDQTEKRVREINKLRLPPGRGSKDEDEDEDE
jgi:hypothetical protein